MTDAPIQFSVGKPIEFVCPNCSAKSLFALQNKIDLSANKANWTKLRDGSLLAATCSGCNSDIPFEFGMLASDKRKKLAFWLDVENDVFSIQKAVEEQKFEDHVLRKVTDSNTLSEIAAIFQDDLDDAAMLLLKHMTAAGYYQDTGKNPLICHYFNRDEESLFFMIITTEDGDPETISMPISSYESLRASAAKAKQHLFPIGTWVTWNDETAMNLWTSIQGQAIK